ncbi:hypothetical protein [Chamaesiphon minutus]|uniref:Uncharacterized protein n=1 Tax=Chamaesiphon minutus (strain ATCC 27169 / PCC 6605) TaxID=1173020 RepID=K9UIZ2_CHAP6|nr:hypothetical protein [Chamaesiphon minutus]AFY94633.1 hypothetical protein Cha6605_3651 [Chamaesiphon minutus PCC 6605]
MAEPTLEEVFGTGTTQTSTTITILKSNLDITAAADNRAESLFAGIVKKASGKLSVASRNENLEQNIAIEQGFPSTAFRGQTPYDQLQLNVTFQKLSPVTSIDPDNY